MLSLSSPFNEHLGPTFPGTFLTDPSSRYAESSENSCMDFQPARTDTSTQSYFHSLSKIPSGSEMPCTWSLMTTIPHPSSAVVHRTTSCLPACPSTPLNTVAASAYEVNSYGLHTLVLWSLVPSRCSLVPPRRSVQAQGQAGELPKGGGLTEREGKGWLTPREPLPFSACL